MMRSKPLLIQLVTKLHSTLQTKHIEKMCCFENQNNTKSIAYMLCKVKLPLLQAVSKLMAVLNNVEHYQLAEPAQKRRLPTPASNVLSDMRLNGIYNIRFYIIWFYFKFYFFVINQVDSSQKNVLHCFFFIQKNSSQVDTRVDQFPPPSVVLYLDSSGNRTCSNLM